MAEEQDRENQTEEPTQHKLEKAIERGDVARSQEVNTWFVLAGGTLAVMMASGPAAGGLAGDLRGFLGSLHGVDHSPAGLMQAGRQAVLMGLGAAFLPLLLLWFSALAGGLLQNWPTLSSEGLQPQLSRISPMAGFKRVFGKEAFVQFVKGLLKLGVISGAMAYVLWPDRARLESFTMLDVTALLPEIKGEIVRLMGGVLVTFAFIAAGDYLYQRITWHNRQKMSRHELKQEFKESEGHPEIKQKIRQLRRERAKNRMMAKVPKATVVVTNPTHFAVALHYERGMQAPQCVAKGMDAVALRIRALATESRVPIVENPPLARALYKAVEVDQEIPAEHYKAVAEVIGYVMRFRRRAS